MSAGSSSKSMTKAELREMRQGFTHPSERTVLAPWMAVGLAMKHLYGLTSQQVIDQMGRKGGKSTLDKVAKSPAGQEWLARVEEEITDPARLVKGLLKLNSLEALADHYLAREWARQARDYKALHAMTKDIALKPILDTGDKGSGARPNIVINLGSKSMETEAVEVDYEVLESEDD